MRDRYIVLFGSIIEGGYNAVGIVEDLTEEEAEALATALTQRIEVVTQDYDAVVKLESSFSRGAALAAEIEVASIQAGVENYGEGDLLRIVVEYVRFAASLLREKRKRQCADERFQRIRLAGYGPQWFDPVATKAVAAWGPHSYGDNWSPGDDCFEYLVEETLYRHADGHWTLLRWRQFQLSDVPQGDPEAIALSTEDAAAWLGMNGEEIPADLAEFADLYAWKPHAPTKPKPGRPKWNSETGELWYRAQVVKQIKRQANNVRCILDSFQEEEWPARIDDPLPPIKNGRQTREQRMHDTIKGLNDNLKVLRFRADGTGEGIMWEEAPSPSESEEQPF